MDGTLLDSEIIHYIVIRDILKREVGIDMPMQDYMKYCGIPDEKMWSMILEETDSTFVDALAERWGIEELAEEGVSTMSAELERLHWEEYDLYIKKNGVKPFPGARELVVALRKEGIRIAVATGSIIRIVQKNLVLLDIAEFVEATATSEDCSNGKPAPDVFLLAAKKLGVEPENCLVVEDAGNGLLGARRAGMTCAGFEGSELPSDTALAPVTFSDYRKVTVEDLRKWHLEQSVK
jgi:HAD superfamily hydrolase (TIGR01509 family)